MQDVAIYRNVAYLTNIQFAIEVVAVKWRVIKFNSNELSDTWIWCLNIER